MINIYEVGGSVRDRLLGLESKDKDFVVVFDDISIGIDKAWNNLIYYLKNQGYEIFLETKSCYTIRARFPENHQHKGLVADFVIARKDIQYNLENRKPNIELGTIKDDILRRDFCCNALYIDENNKIIDLTGKGFSDIENKILRTPLEVNKTLLDDPLRIFRAIRFAIIKGFSLNFDLVEAILDNDFNFNMISTERVREELYKCFKHDTLKTLAYLEGFPKVKEYAFANQKLWLKPTNELK